MRRCDFGAGEGRHIGGMPSVLSRLVLLAPHGSLAKSLEGGRHQQVHIVDAVLRKINDTHRQEADSGIILFFQSKSLASACERLAHETLGAAAPRE